MKESEARAGSSKYMILTSSYSNRPRARWYDADHGKREQPAALMRQGIQEFVEESESRGTPASETSSTASHECHWRACAGEARESEMRLDRAVGTPHAMMQAKVPIVNRTSIAM